MKKLFRRFVRLAYWAFSLSVIACVGVAICGLDDHPGKADVALVLGNKVELTGKPSARLVSRLERTLELYRDGWFPMIMVSGGLGKEGFDEAVVMRDYLIAHGVPADRIIADSQGWTTYDSAKNVAALLKSRGWSSVFVVTQYYHVPRSRLAVSNFGVKTLYWAHARYFGPKDLLGIPREIAGLVSYTLRGY